MFDFLSDTDNELVTQTRADIIKLILSSKKDVVPQSTLNSLLSRINTASVLHKRDFTGAKERSEIGGYIHIGARDYIVVFRRVNSENRQVVIAFAKDAAYSIERLIGEVSLW